MKKKATEETSTHKNIKCCDENDFSLGGCHLFELLETQRLYSIMRLSNILYILRRVKNVSKGIIIQ